MIIGFCGLAHSGKSEAAKRLVNSHGFRRVAFADPLRAMMHGLGLTDDDMGAGKEIPSDMLCGRSPRQALQWLGTEYGRNLIGPDLWVRAWAREAQQWPSVVADDVRFPNEADVIRSAGGKVVRVLRTSAGLSGHTATHESECADFIADCEIENNGDIAALWRAVDALM